MARRWLSGKKEQTTNTGSTPDKPIANWYRSIHELPLKHFETVYVDQNLFALVISGSPTIDDLSKAWENIQSEYADALGNADYKMYVSVYKEITLMNITYEQILFIVAPGDEEGNGKGILLKLCSPQFDTEVKFFANEINDLLRFRPRLNTNDPASYFAEVEKCYRRSKAIKIQLDMKRLEFEGVEKKFNKSGEQMEKSFFTSMLIFLSKHNGYKITKDITVAEYCEYVKQYNRFVELESKKK